VGAQVIEQLVPAAEAPSDRIVGRLLHPFERRDSAQVDDRPE
jgi:hypothetical protein